MEKFKRVFQLKKTLLKNQVPSATNGVKTKKYFKLERRARQSDPISVYLFILILEYFL